MSDENVTPTDLPETPAAQAAVTLAVADTSESEFEAGFDEVSAAPTETPAAQEPESPVAPEPVAPKYAAITEEAFAELMSKAKALDELKVTAEKSFGTAFGKLGGVERDLREIKVALANQAPPLEMSDDEVQAIKADFPALGTMLDRMRAAKTNQASDLEKMRRLLETRLLSAQHDDWQDVCQSTQFDQWARNKGEAYYTQLLQANDSWDSGTIVRALSQFKTDAAKAEPVNSGDSKPAQPAQTQQVIRQRIAANVTPRGLPGPIAKATKPIDEFEAGFYGT